MDARARNESAMSMIEILVVMLIVIVISTVSFMGISGARKSGGRMETAAAARRYGDAIERYQQEHGRQTPTIGDATSWPGGTNAVKGPIFRVDIGKQITRYYLKGSRAPEIMTKGGPTGAVLQAGKSCAPQPTGGTLVYRVGPVAAGKCGPALSSRFQYSIRVFWEGDMYCDVGDVSTKVC
jgi:type II secretory pathway pseudopilin PulG